MSAGVEGLAGVVGAAEVVSPAGFRLAGRFFGTPPGAPQQPDGGALLPLLQAALYEHCYAHPFRGALHVPPALPPPDDDLVPSLAAAHPGRERWEGGWQVVQALPTGQVVARRHGATRFLWPGEFLSHAGPGMPPRAGGAVSVWVPRDSATVQPGFYFAFGETPGDPLDDAGLVRFYWAVRDTGAAALLRALVGALNRFGVPFRFKCLSRRSAYPRTDAAVLYAGRRYFHLAAELALELHGGLAAHLGAETPLFTRRLAPGLAFAEDPATGESFGMHRCALLAEGLLSAFFQGARSPEERLREVEAAFRRRGVELERPHLNPGSPHRYELPGHAA